MKLLNKICAVFLSCIFLVSFAGISLILHHCLECEDTDYYFASHVKQIEHHHHNHQECAEHCDNDGCGHTSETHDHHSCGIFGSENCCCKTEVEYLKSDFESLQASGLDIILKPLCLEEKIESKDVCCNECISDKLIDFTHDPPPKLVSREFIIFTSHLKYC